MSDVDGLCSVHGGRLDPVELGRKGGKARGKSKGKRGSFRAAVAGLLERDPDRYAAELLNSGAAGFKLASDLLEKEEAKAQAETAAPLVDETGRRVTSLRDLVASCARMELDGNPHLRQIVLGISLTPDQLRAIVALDDEERAKRGDPPGGGSGRCRYGESSSRSRCVYLRVRGRAASPGGPPRG